MEGKRAGDGGKTSPVRAAGRVAWVSGASSGLGRAAAVALRAAGWRVVCGARSFPAADKVTDVRFRIRLDVTDPDSVAAFRDKAVSLCGTPDALVCAAGVLTLGPAEDVSEDELRAVLDTTLLGGVRMARAALPLMRQAGGGKIVLISSVNGLMATPFQGAYSMAKHALEAFGECLALETRNQGVQVTLVEPGDHQGGKAKYRSRAARVQPVYQESMERVCGVIAHDEATGQKPGNFGRALARLLNRRRMPLRKRFASPLQKFAVVAHDVLPGRLYLRLFSKYYRV